MADDSIKKINADAADNASDAIERIKEFLSEEFREDVVIKFIEKLAAIQVSGKPTVISVGAMAAGFLADALSLALSLEIQTRPEGP